VKSRSIRYSSAKRDPAHEVLLAETKPIQILHRQQQKTIVKNHRFWTKSKNELGEYWVDLEKLQ